MIIIVIWIVILTLILGPKASAIAAEKLPADINILIIYLNLCIVAPALIAHNAFWLRWPLTLPNPPGTPPPDQAASNGEALGGFSRGFFILPSTSPDSLPPQVKSELARLAEICFNSTPEIRPWNGSSKPSNLESWRWVS